MNLAQSVIDVGEVNLIAMVIQISQPGSQREPFYQNAGKLLRNGCRILAKAVRLKNSKIDFGD